MSVVRNSTANRKRATNPGALFSFEMLIKKKKESEHDSSHIGDDNDTSSAIGIEQIESR